MAMGRFGAMAAGTAARLCAWSTQAAPITITAPAIPAGAAMDGRVIVIVSPKDTPEPREQVQLESELTTPYIFGQTVDGLTAGASVALDAGAYGWPVRSPDALPPGDYTVQAVLNRYETFHRADGSTVKLPPDEGEGQHWNAKPRNLYSRPVRVHLGPGSAPLTLRLDQVIRPSRPRPTPSSSATSASRVRYCRSSGAALCISAPTSSCPQALRRIPARTIR